MASRYASFESRSSGSSTSTPTSSADLRRAPKGVPPSMALAKARQSEMVTKNVHNFGAMVKKFMEKKTRPKAAALPVPVDTIAKERKKVSGLSELNKKLFRKGNIEENKGTKALTESKANTRTLAMVLRSERELLSQNKEYEEELLKLRIALEERNREVDKLKDLCLKQREEMKVLKDAVLFPDVMNVHLHSLLETQSSELKEAKTMIPTLQKQVSSLTGRLQCLAEDLAEVKADKYSGRSSDGSFISSRTPMYRTEAALTSMAFSSSEHLSCASPDATLFGDINPCLTPSFSRCKSKDFSSLMTQNSP